MGTTATVAEDGVTAGPVDVPIQTKGGLSVLKKLINLVKHCVSRKVLTWLALASFPHFRRKQLFSVTAVRSLLCVQVVFFLT